VTKTVHIINPKTLVEAVAPGERTPVYGLVSCKFAKRTRRSGSHPPVRSTSR
jgi:hypothetical protein